jgi:hypothetical protein
MLNYDVKAIIRRLLRDRGIAWEIEAEASTEMDKAIAGFLGESA